LDVAEDTIEARPLGQVFAAERERQGLSRAEAAQRLHMSAWQIEALESGDYARLPQGTFLRGFVRNYAKALSLDSDAMLERLAQSAPRGRTPGIVVPSQNIRFDPMGERLSNPYFKAGGLAVVLIAFGFAGLYWLFFIHGKSPVAVAKKEPAPQNLAAAPLPAPEPPVIAHAPTLEPPRAEAAKAEPAPKVEPPKPEPPKVEPPKREPPKAEAPKSEPPKAVPAKATGAAERTLKLRFKGEAWVEIKDRSGRVLLSRINPPGSEAEVSGRPPFAVVIGNAPEVQMLYENREFALEPHTKVAVARFTLE
jgi:cytoskeleton protein RodZ